MSTDTHISLQCEDGSLEWSMFLMSLSPATRVLAEGFPTWKQYRIKESGQLCTIAGYVDPTTVTDHASIAVFVAHPEFEGVLVRVFGLKPEDLEIAPQSFH